MAKNAKQSLKQTANQSPSVVAMVMGFLFIFAGIAFPSMSGLLLEIAGFILLIAGVVTVYWLGGAHRKR